MSVKKWGYLVWTNCSHSVSSGLVSKNKAWAHWSGDGEFPPTYFIPFILLPSGRFLCTMSMVLPRLFIRPSSAGFQPSLTVHLTDQKSLDFKTV